jgi:hypothetical protein
MLEELGIAKGVSQSEVVMQLSLLASGHEVEYIRVACPDTSQLSVYFEIVGIS